MDEILKKLDELEKKLDAISTGYQLELSKTLGSREIEELYGLPKGSTYTYNRLYLPNFGRTGSLKKPRDMRWTLKEVIDWNLRPYENRAWEYEKLQK